MDKIQRQILQLKNEWEKELSCQQRERQKILEEAQDLINETQEDIEWLQFHRLEREVAPPQPPTTPISESSSAPGTDNSYQGRIPSDEDLYKIAANPEKFGGFFEELDACFESDRATQTTQVTTEGKWFVGDRVPSIEEMLNQKNFAEMLKELEQI